jgi:hypothetical protein
MYEDQQQTRPYGNQTAGNRVFLHQFKHGQGASKLALGAYLVGLAGILLAAFCLWQLTSIKTTAASLQNVASQQASDIATLHKQLVAEQQAAGGYASLPGEVKSMQGKLARLGAYSAECSAPVTAPSGNPAQAFFRCSYQRQG